MKPEALIRASLNHTNKPSALFGAKILHCDYVELTILEAGDSYGEMGDRYIGGKKIVSIEMSSFQFAEFITSMNRGCGTPCTITRFEGKQVERPIQDNPAERYANNFKKKIKSVTDKIVALEDSIREIQDIPSIPKGKRKDLLDQAKSANMQLTDSIPFIVEYFRETMAEVVQDAKSEIDSHVTRTIHETGITSIKNQLECK